MDSGKIGIAEALVEVVTMVIEALADIIGAPADTIEALAEIVGHLGMVMTIGTIGIPAHIGHDSQIMQADVTTVTVSVILQKIVGPRPAIDSQQRILRVNMRSVPVLTVTPHPTKCTKCTAK
jgi:hypothetical protein